MIQKRIENYWDHRADTYSEYVNREMAGEKRQAWEALLKRYAGEKQILKVLDVGTGPGFFAMLLAGLGHEVTAVDASADMLQAANKNTVGLAIRFLQGDAHKINLPDGSFDLIVSRNVTWTLPNPAAAYREWYRLLNAAGRVLIFDANWYLRLADPELERQYEHYRQLAVNKGFTDRVSAEQQRESEAIARKLPLTYEKRPAWDQAALRQCGFQEIVIQENLNELVLDELEKIIYYPTPMFAICAAK